MGLSNDFISGCFRCLVFVFWREFLIWKFFFRMKNGEFDFEGVVGIV